jgi:hypothetical protein
MKSVLVISLLTILRLGIPATVLLLVGEAVKRGFGQRRSV